MSDAQQPIHMSSGLPSTVLPEPDAAVAEALAAASSADDPRGALAEVVAANPRLSAGWAALGASGWVQVNGSSPALPGDPWFQGNPGVFGSESGAPDSYIATNWNSAEVPGVVSNWLILPELTLSAFNTFSFATRCAGALAGGAVALLAPQG